MEQTLAAFRRKSMQEERRTGFVICCLGVFVCVIDHALSRSVPSSCDTFASLRLFLASKRERVFCLHSSRLWAQPTFCAAEQWNLDLCLAGAVGRRADPNPFWSERAQEGWNVAMARPTDLPTEEEAVEMGVLPPVPGGDRDPDLEVRSGRGRSSSRAVEDRPRSSQGLSVERKRPLKFATPASLEWQHRQWKRPRCQRRLANRREDACGWRWSSTRSGRASSWRGQEDSHEG